MEDNYFDKYRESKLCLYMMVGQFLNTYIGKDIANKMGINIDSDYFVFGDDVEVCFHNYASEGLLAWDYLDLKEDFVSHEEIWDLRLKIRNEEYKDGIDYKEKYLKNCILLIDLTKKYYGGKMSLSKAKAMNIPFDEEEDEFDDEVSTCFHIFESAGENVWNLFGIDVPIVGESVFDNKRNYYCKQLMNKKKTKKIVKNQ